MTRRANSPTRSVPTSVDRRGGVKPDKEVADKKVLSTGEVYWFLRCKEPLTAKLATFSSNFSSRSVAATNRGISSLHLSQEIHNQLLE